MSKNVALNLSELVVSIVFATVVPDWECKSAGFIFNMQALHQSIFKVFFNHIPNLLKINFKSNEKIFSFFSTQIIAKTRIGKMRTELAKMGIYPAQWKVCH
jgi:hypothetical protein